VTGTNVTRDPDSVVAAWLDDVPTELPDVTRRAILGALPTTSQARRGLRAPWRSIYMNAFARGAAVVVIAVVAIGVAALLASPRNGVAGPSPSPVSSPGSSSAASALSTLESAPPLPTLDATFESPSYGYQIRYPAGWTVTTGHGPWQFGTTLGPGDPVTDSIVTPSGLHRMRISIASIALPSGTSIGEFRSFASPYSKPFNADPCAFLEPLPEPVTINYQPNLTGTPEKVAAVVSINGCAALAELGGSVYDLEVIAGGRGYEFILDGELTPADAMAWLGAITLEPTKGAAPNPAASQ
jgi:hypothetical protein